MLFWYFDVVTCWVEIERCTCTAYAVKIWLDTILNYFLISRWPWARCRRTSVSNDGGHTKPDIELSSTVHQREATNQRVALTSPVVHRAHGAASGADWPAPLLNDTFELATLSSHTKENALNSFLTKHRSIINCTVFLLIFDSSLTIPAHAVSTLLYKSSNIPHIL